MNQAAVEDCATAFLSALRADGINPNALNAEQFSAMNRLFNAGFQAGGEFVLKQTKQTVDDLLARRRAAPS